MFWEECNSPVFGGSRGGAAEQEKRPELPVRGAFVICADNGVLLLRRLRHRLLLHPPPFSPASAAEGCSDSL